MKKALLLIVALMVAMSFFATPGIAAEKLKFGYISKFLNHPWFLAESAGAEKFCKENGIEYIFADANTDDEKCMQLVDSFIAKGIKALLICATSEGLGAAIAKKCADAGVVLITIDDAMKDHNSKPIPHVGMPTREVGVFGGGELAKMAKARNFFKKGNVVKTILVDCTRLTVFHDRLLGYQEALAKNTPLKSGADFFTADTENTIMDEALVSVSAIVSANPQVTHWIACGGNDDTAIAAIRVFEEMGIDNYLSCGLGGYDLALEELAKGNKNFITIGLRPDIEGYKAAELAYNFITKGTPIPATTFVGGTINNVDNYKESPFWKE